MAEVIVSQSEREFSLDELFFSITDPKGIIRSGNSVFVRVSGYTLDELLGRPHSIIRHPDMPRAVFKLLWTYLEAGKPIAAYVKNRAKDGAYYWVVATVTPIEGGYLSVRLKPSSPVLGVVRDVYREIVAYEHSLEATHARKAVIELSSARLLAKLNELGFPDYDTFMQKALSGEMRSRAAALASEPGQAPAARSATDSPFALSLHEILHSSGGLLRYLDSLFANLDTYISLNETLSRKAHFVLSLAEDIRIFTLNAILLATRLDNAATLEEVAALMRERAVSTAGLIGHLGRDVDGVVAILRDLNFQISVAKVQAEMARDFARDLLAEHDDTSADDRVRHDLRDLIQCLNLGMTEVFAAFSQVDQGLRTIGNAVDSLSHDLRSLGVLQVTGRVEAARIPEAGDFAHLFGELKLKIDSASHEVVEFSDAVALGRDTTRGNESTAADQMSRMVRRSVALAS
ncbi:MAG: PAS domain-containing protein [Vicinamibacterales bacterium]